MERSITLTILAEDIENNSYYNYESCPITRALHRAGHEYAFDSGGIEGIINGEVVSITSYGNKDYDAMLTKVLKMYGTKNGRRDSEFALPIETFTVTINY